MLKCGVMNLNMGCFVICVIRFVHIVLFCLEWFVHLFLWMYFVCLFIMGDGWVGFVLKCWMMIGWIFEVGVIWYWNRCLFLCLMIFYLILFVVFCCSLGWIWVGNLFICVKLFLFLLWFRLVCLFWLIERGLVLLIGCSLELVFMMIFVEGVRHLWLRWLRWFIFCVGWFFVYWCCLMRLVVGHLFSMGLLLFGWSLRMFLVVLVVVVCLLCIIINL